MNTKRIILGGLAAGLVMNVLDFVTNVVLYGEQWRDIYRALGLPTENPAVPAFWISFDFFSGLLIAFLYAAMRPRFGAGPRAALVAALVVTGVCHLTLFSHIADGVFPAVLLLKCGALELVSAILGGLVAGRLYREDDGTATATATRTAAA